MGAPAVVPPPHQALRGGMSPSTAHTHAGGGIFAVLVLLKIKNVSIARACG